MTTPILSQKGYNDKKKTVEGLTSCSGCSQNIFTLLAADMTVGVAWLGTLVVWFVVQNVLSL